MVLNLICAVCKCLFVILCAVNEEQKKIAQDLIDKANKSGLFPKKIVTSLEKFDKFYKAEEYHQNYLSKNPNGYSCHKIRKDWEF